MGGYDQSRSGRNAMSNFVINFAFGVSYIEIWQFVWGVFAAGGGAGYWNKHFSINIDPLGIY